MPIGQAELERRFRFHHAPAGAKDFYEYVRSQMLDMAKWFDEVLPDGREKSIAVHHLEDASMWAIKAHVLQFPTEPYDGDPS